MDLHVWSVIISRAHYVEWKLPLFLVGYAPRKGLGDCLLVESILNPPTYASAAKDIEHKWLSASARLLLPVGEQALDIKAAQVGVTHWVRSVLQQIVLAASQRHEARHGAVREEISRLSNVRVLDISFITRVKSDFTVVPGAQELLSISNIRVMVLSLNGYSGLPE